MKYQGIVKLKIKNNYHTVFETTNHNGGTEILQIAFANMLTGYDNKAYLPYAMSASDNNGITFSKTKITGLNKQQVQLQIDGQQKNVWCATVNAVFPLQRDMQVETVAGYTYHLWTENEGELATVDFDTSSITSPIQFEEGLQVNIVWQLYLAI